MKFPKNNHVSISNKTKLSKGLTNLTKLFINTFIGEMWCNLNGKVFCEVNWFLNQFA
jgi:hypothetical protein